VKLKLPDVLVVIVAFIVVIIVTFWAVGRVWSAEGQEFRASQENHRLKWLVETQANELNRLENRMRVAGLRVR